MIAQLTMFERIAHPVTTVATEEDNPLGLPPEVLCLALNQPYADLVVGGVKTLETRTWAWPYPPSWLAIYATRNAEEPAMKRLRSRIADPDHLPLGAIVGLVFVTGSRLMEREDEEAACYPFELARFVWPLERAHRFPEPERKHLKRGPQKFVRIPRAVVLGALRANPCR